MSGPPPGYEDDDEDYGHFCLSSRFLLAAIEHLGWLSHEQSHLLMELTESVIPLSYESVLSVVGDAFAQLPPWDSCVHCRAEMANHKVRIVNWHAAEHPALEQPTTESA